MVVEHTLDLRGPCGALTRGGFPCRRVGAGKGNRCHLHGGKSTGPRTAAGKARIAAAQRARWEAERARKRNPPAAPVQSRASPSHAELFDCVDSSLPNLTVYPGRNRYG